MVFLFTFDGPYGLPAMDGNLVVAACSLVLLWVISYFVVAERHSSTPSTVKVPEQVRHSFRLSDGRTFSYYTFSCGSDDDEPKSDFTPELRDSPLRTGCRHPVLYLHGFPSCGREGSACAAHVAAEGGELFAPDRPGFGHTQPPLSGEKDGGGPDGRIRSCVRDLWEFVRHQGWDSFSIVGVSGGGPYALALLASFLELRDSTVEQPPAEIRAVSLVAGVCCSVGADGMMPTNQTLHRVASAYPNSRWARAQLCIMFALPSVLVKILPASLMLKMLPKELPPVDYDIMTDRTFGTFLIGVLWDSLRQGGRSATLEGEALFRSSPAFFEEMLKKHSCRQGAAASSTLPPVACYHGMLDKNVPPSHSEYVHRELLGGASKLVTFDDLGHMSLVLDKAADYSHFAVVGKAEQCALEE